MRWRHIMLAAVLVTAACGSTSESSVGTPAPSSESVPANAEAARAAIEASTDALIAALGDEQTALAAVLLASDLGYSVGQIVPAGVAGRLQPDGLIVSPDGAPSTPDNEPSGIFDDDVTGDTSEASGLRASPKRMPLTAAMHEMNVALGGSRGSLFYLLLLFNIGYTLEQIVLAVLAGDLTDSQACLVDQNGNVIGPEGSPKDKWQDHCKAAVSTTATSADTTAPGESAATLDASVCDTADEVALEAWQFTEGDVFYGVSEHDWFLCLYGDGVAGRIRPLWAGAIVNTYVITGTTYRFESNVPAVHELSGTERVRTNVFEMTRTGDVLEGVVVWTGWEWDSRTPPHDWVISQQEPETETVRAVLLPRPS